MNYIYSSDWHYWGGGGGGGVVRKSKS